MCLCFKFENDQSKLRLQKTVKGKLADLSIQTADLKRARCFVNMQQMALNFLWYICFQSIESSFIVNESDVRIG